MRARVPEAASLGHMYAHKDAHSSSVNAQAHRDPETPSGGVGMGGISWDP